MKPKRIFLNNNAVDVNSTQQVDLKPGGKIAVLYQNESSSYIKMEIPAFNLKYTKHLQQQNAVLVSGIMAHVRSLGAAAIKNPPGIDFVKLLARAGIKNPAGGGKK